MHDLSHFCIIQLPLGPMNNFIYVLSNTKTNEAVVIDPAWDVDAIQKTLIQKGLKLSSVLITHGHPDHTNGIDQLLTHHDVPVYVSKHEASYYKPVGDAIHGISDLDKLMLGDIEIECLLTPGHTPGSQCFLVGEHLIAGDTLFLDGCGRCDLPGGNAEIMYDTLYNKLMKLPDHIMVYPGHDYHPSKKQDCLKNQKKTNPFLTCQSKKEFLSTRMGV